MMALRLLIIADDPLARAGLSALLAQQPGCAVVGQLANDTTVLASIQIYQPDVVVWDLGWDSALHAGSSSGVEPALLEQLIGIHEAGYRVLALLPDEAPVGPLWTAGVRGFVLRETAASLVAAALQALAQGLTVLDAVLSRALLPSGGGLPTASRDSLTSREHEVLQLVAEGLPNKTIAARLRISEHTVKFHLNALMTKLGAQSRTEVVVRATRLGWLIL